MIAARGLDEAWGQLQSEFLSALFGWLLFLLWTAVTVVFGFGLAWRRRAFLIDQAVKRDRVLRAIEDEVSQTVRLPAQRGSVES